MVVVTLAAYRWLAAHAGWSKSRRSLDAVLYSSMNRVNSNSGCAYCPAHSTINTVLIIIIIIHCCWLGMHRMSRYCCRNSVIIHLSVSSCVALIVHVRMVRDTNIWFSLHGTVRIQVFLPELMVLGLRVHPEWGHQKTLLLKVFHLFTMLSTRKRWS